MKMDWKKTKNILIFALIIMNVLLIYNIYFKDNSSSSNLDDFDSVKELLLERNIDINDIDYKVYSEMPRFKVYKFKYNLLQLSELQKQGFSITDNEDILRIEGDYEKGSLEDIDMMVDKIITALGIEPDQIQMMHSYKSQGVEYRIYNQKINGYLFDDGYLKVENVENKSIVADYQWLEVEQLDEYLNDEIYPIEKSILSLINFNADSKRNLKIVNYEIVYHVDEQDQLLIDNLTSIEPIPYWRAISESGEVYYLNGLR